MIIIKCEQGSDEWFAARAGRATASEFSSVLAKGQGITRTKYLRRVVAERLTGKPVETYKNDHMERGSAQEAAAREAYEARAGVFVDPVGFIQHDKMLAGASPDGLVDKDGMIEIKCVLPTVQIETILAGGYPSEHRAQIQGGLWIAERQWCDFVSYSPDLPPHLSIYVNRVTREASYILGLQAEVAVFLQEVDKMIAQLNERSPA